MGKKPNKKPTAREIIELIFMGLTALATVMSSIATLISVITQR